ncbi:Non-heme 11 kDa protein of cytochrome bc1 complex [Aaosphaeria arxii CBS 175.79]|uniref:Cytochrome b-c1 complex subunit 6, mitochondrial n=1 Tax=Aaosphaeria arxii CBS 175.79 TaxID=1450172 RepID=A0A6A5Y7H7_9PLEO|nr:Non-heme 11 kDa protein of cytochrome bc1 complex [Aaosphaeria arxii CBS 175.79]KAF2020760.1 Non-heme 11 kDa protein of cytochrome bc1 complex [Aaosphaeria arxii CBS 175.79]
MGITDFISAAWDTFSTPSPDAEEPAQANKEEESSDEKEESSDDAEEEEEEEEEEETVDPKETLEEECRNSKECHPAKHHYDACVERVTSQIDNDGKASEDCVEEFFHLAHCATACAAPKLFSQLK